MELGTPELIIILVIVVVLFGGGRVARIGGELGRGIREFRRGLAGDDAPASDALSSSAPVSGAPPAADRPSGEASPSNGPRSGAPSM